MNKIVKVVIGCLLGLLLVGCNRLHGPYGTRYYVKDSYTVRKLVIPAGIKSPVGDQYYAVNHPPYPNTRPRVLYPPDPYFLQLKRQQSSKRVKSKVYAN